MKVALSYNVKPESETFHERLSPESKQKFNSQKEQNDLFAEWDTWNTINAVKEALEVYSDVSLVEADLSSFEKFREIKPDIVFNIAEGFYGESREAQIPAMLDMLQIPYTGSDPLTLTTCLDKARAKEILSYYGVPNARFFIAHTPADASNRKLNFPLMVKPLWEGSSKGIFSSSLVYNEEELFRETEKIHFEYSQPSIIEEYLPGREFTVAIIGNGSEAEVLPIVEIDYKSFPDSIIPIYSYEAKWILDTKENPLDVFSCPANLTPQQEMIIKDTALRSYNVLRCRDWSRIDVRMDAKGVPNIIEINPLPGILPDPKENSCFPKAARTAGYSYNDMLNKVLLSGARRYNIF